MAIGGTVIDKPVRTDFVFGANPEHVIGIRQTIWDFSTNYSFMSSAQTLSVVSSNVNDTTLGTGARSITIFGLDTNYNEINETVALNGTTPVLTTQLFLRRNRIIVASTGSANQNIGNITISGDSVQGYIAAGVGRDRSTIYTVPAGYKGRLKQIYASIGPSANAAGIKYGDLDIYIAEFNTSGRFTNLSFLMSNGSQYVDITFGNYREFNEKTDMVLVINTEKEGTATQGFFEVFLEPSL